MMTLIEALRGKKTQTIPVWLMRQAGRYLPEYRALRARKKGFMDMALDPQAACEITMQPIRRFGMNGAIIFSDILMVPYALGQSVDFQAGEGPVLGVYDFASLSLEKFSHCLQPVYEALRLTKSALAREGFLDTALLGFCGAPWTVATYMIEGGSSKDFATIKTLAYAQPEMFQKLIDLLVEASIIYLRAQIDAGAQAVQVFESWASALQADQFVRWSMDPMKRIVAALRTSHPDIPVIGFPRGAGMLYTDYVQTTGVNTVGVDFQIPTRWACDHLQNHVCVQGNLDPMVLRAGGKVLDDAAKRILDDLSHGPFVFNLGHGVHKDTDPAHVARLIQIIRDYR